uniref:Ribosomal protein S4 n=1 Tax=Imasa heleensis TaxID=2772037 RepID=A0A893DDD4_9EUKA|nr:ribosomal protein S4 [Imasa heleensis]QRR29757.1 ribosomal protein S4 [Imasa heleensis]
MNKRLKRIYRIHYQTKLDLWYKPNLYNRLSKKRVNKQREKLSVLDIGKELTQKVDFYNRRKSLSLLKKYYLNVSKKYIDKAILKKNYYVRKYNNILNTLELRLDTLIYRMNWSTSLAESRHLISYGHILVNGFKLNRPNYLLTIGDTIEVRKESIKNIKRHISNKIKEGELKINCPNYIEVDYDILKSILLYSPDNYEIPYPSIMNMQQKVQLIC